MNYRHAFHAGNHADILKHAVYIASLQRLAQKPSPFAVLDVHAGIGRYDLQSDAAARSPEWRDGVAKLIDWPHPPALLQPLLSAIATLNQGATDMRFYPGSPYVAAMHMRAIDRLVLCELHADDFPILRTNMRFDKQTSPAIECHRRDAFEALGALLPPREKRGLVLIDPPYEQIDELKAATDGLRAALSRFAHGGFIWWRPLKDPAALNRADAELGAAGLQAWLRADLWLDTPTPTGKLVGSSLFIINPAFGLRELLHQALPQLADRLAHNLHAGWRLDGAG